MPTNFEEDYSKILQENGGSRYYQVDLHLHTPYSDDFDDNSLTLEDFLNKIEELGFELIFATDHAFGTEEFKRAFDSLSNETSVKVFPATEITTGDGIHIALVFDQTTSPEEIHDVLVQLEVSNDNTHETSKTLNDENFLKLIEKKCSLWIFPHANLNKGVWHEMRGNRRKEFFSNPKNVKFLNLPPLPSTATLPSHPNCAHIRPAERETNIGYPSELRRLREESAFIKSSDSHSIVILEEMVASCLDCSNYDYCHKGIMWLKLAERSLNAVSQISYDSVNRIKWRPPEENLHSYLIGMTVSGGFFKDQIFHFSPWLNILIGSRGTGKSLTIELIRFVLGDIPENAESEGGFNQKLLEHLGGNNGVRLFFHHEDGSIYVIERILRGQKERNKWKLQSTLRKLYKYNESMGFQFERDLEDSDYNDLTEIFGQNELPNLSKELKKQLQILDRFNLSTISINISILEERKRTYSSKKEELSTIYTNLLQEIQSYLSYLDKWEEYGKISETVVEEIFQKDLEWEKLAAFFQEWIEALDSVSVSFSEYIMPELSIPVEGQFPDNFRNLASLLMEIESEFINDIEKTQDETTHIIQNFADSISFIKIWWQPFFTRHKQEYNRILEEKGIAGLQDLQQRRTNLRQEIENNSATLANIMRYKKQIRTLFNDLHIFAIEIEKAHDNLTKLRKRLARNIRKNLGEKKFNLLLRNYIQDDLDSFLHSIAQNSQYDFLLAYNPWQLFVAIVNKDGSLENLKNLNPEKRNLKIFEKIGYLIDNISSFMQETLEVETPLTKFLRKYRIHLFDKLLLSIPEIPYEDKLEVQLKKGTRFRNILETSLGEKVSSILNILLMAEKKILVLDQPDAELDFDSIQGIIKLILRFKHHRQILIATHDPNIPSLGDADQIFFLEQYRDESDIDSDFGKIAANGGFESMIEYILKLEGGPEAIRKRIEKYMIS